MTESEEKTARKFGLFKPVDDEEIILEIEEILDNNKSLTKEDEANLHSLRLILLS